MPVILRLLARMRGTASQPPLTCPPSRLPATACRASVAVKAEGNIVAAVVNTSYRFIRHRSRSLLPDCVRAASDTRGLGKCVRWLGFVKWLAAHWQPGLRVLAARMWNRVDSERRVNTRLPLSWLLDTITLNCRNNCREFILRVVSNNSFFHCEFITGKWSYMPSCIKVVTLDCEQ